MYVRRVKRKCGVRGCKNTDCFAISLVREAGNSIIACKSCLEKAVGAIDEIGPDAKSNIPVNNNAEIPPLFFNHKIKRAESTPVVEVATEQEETEPLADEKDIKQDAEHVCPDCGKVFDSEKGLKTHARHCKKQEEKETDAE